MSPGEIPRTPDDIDPTWLSAALQPRFPGVEVISVDVADRREVTNCHSTLRIASRGASGVPTTMFCKLPPESERRPAILATGMGQREARFYSRLAPSLQLRTPSVFLAAHDDADGAFVMLLEDLVAAGCAVSDGTWGIQPDAAAAALEDLAQMHIRYSDPAVRLDSAPWVEPSRPGSQHVMTTLRFGLANHRDQISPSFARLAEMYVEDPSAIHAVWQVGPTTVVHGDTHIGNLFVDRGRTGFLDWGMVSVTTPMRDLSYFITMALGVADRRDHERDLIRHYLSIWNAASGDPITFDQAWTAHRTHAAYCVPACCQIVTFPDGMTERRRVFANALLERGEAAVNDLDALSAVQEALS